MNHDVHLIFAFIFFGVNQLKFVQLINSDRPELAHLRD